MRALLDKGRDYVVSRSANPGGSWEGYCAGKDTERLKSDIQSLAPDFTEGAIDIICAGDGNIYVAALAVTKAQARAAILARADSTLTQWHKADLENIFSVVFGEDL